MEHSTAGKAIPSTESYDDADLEFRHKLELRTDDFCFTFKFGHGEFEEMEKLMKSIETRGSHRFEVHNMDASIYHNNGFVEFCLINDDIQRLYTESVFKVKASIVYDALVKMHESECI